MKIMHTSDWHIGKIVNEFSMIEDQKHMLEQLIQLIEQEKPQVLVVAGDIYDRSIPPNEAINLLDEVLSELTIRLNIKVMMTAGNHDGAQRLGFGNRLMEKQGLYIAAESEELYKKIAVEEKGQKVNFYLVPYKDPALVRKIVGDVNLKTHEDAMCETIRQIKCEMNQEEVNVLVAHGYITNHKKEEEHISYQEASLETSESERPLAIGGTDLIDARLFDDFEYVALGHLHGPQKVGRECVRYSGSLLRYSFSEVKQKKGAVVIEVVEDTNLEVRFEELKPLRQMRIIKGELNELVEKGRQEVEGRDDYIQAVLTDQGELMNPIDKLRAVYKNVMLITKEEDREYGEIEGAALATYKEKSKIELFDEFYEEMKYELTPEKKEVVEQVIDEILRKGEV